MRKTALVTGISGQDGGYLAALLLKQGYQVIGTSRDANANRFEGLRKLNIQDKVILDSMSLIDFQSILRVIHQYEPDEIYNLAGQTSVVLSFDQPVETYESIVIATVNLLEALRMSNKTIRLYNAGSSEMFGNTKGEPASEVTRLHPRSPYGIAKATSFWQIAQHREAYGVHACTGILFNHESPLRPERFVTQKIVKGACDIANGSAQTLPLGDLSVQRDWGWAPEYVVAMHSMLQQEHPEDFVIATGHTSSLEAFVAEVFSTLGLNWKEYVVRDPRFIRPSDLSIGRADPALAAKRLGWQARYKMKDVARMMVEAQLADAKVD
ncbi:MAG: GDP-mannose 4,6-dehydratase [Pirellulales bacterium]